MNPLGAANPVTMKALEASLPGVEQKEAYLAGQRFWGEFLAYLRRLRPRNSDRHIHRKYCYVRNFSGLYTSCMFWCIFFIPRNFGLRLILGVIFICGGLCTCLSNRRMVYLIGGICIIFGWIVLMAPVKG